MIPKIIHYCWFGPNAMPKMVEMCVSTWKEHLVGYEFMFWNESNSPMDFPFVKEAYAKGKYAFVSDYVRLWAVSRHGGIYLDTDMYLLKPLDDFLIFEFFSGYEEANEINISAGIFGAQPNNEYIDAVLQRYSEIKIGYDFTQIAIPLILTETYRTYSQKETLTIFNYRYFYPFPHKDRRKKDFLAYATTETYAIHLWNFSWLSFSEKIFLRFIWAAKFLGLVKR